MAKDEQCGKVVVNNQKAHGIMGGAYGLFFVGVLIYYLQNSVGFWGAVVAILKAIVWPALLIYKVFSLLNM